MLTIRLSRVGRKNVKNFRIVVSEKSKSPKRGAFDIIGYYNPETNPYTFEFDKTKVEMYLKNGAIASPTLARLFEKAGMKNIQTAFESKKKFNAMTKDKEKLAAMKKAEEEAKAAKIAAAAPKVEEAPVAETPAEEPKAE